MKFWLKDILRDKEPEAGGVGGDKSGDGSTPPDNKDKGGDKGLDKDTQAAVALYKALQDPDISTDVIENLARRAGLLDRDKNRRSKDDDGDSKPKESRAAKKLREKLGKDYEKFADTVGPAFDELIAEAVGELRNHSSAERETERWTNQVDRFMETHELTEDIEDKMKDLMEDSPPNTGRKGFDAQKYLARMYKNACEELDIEIPKPKRTSRQRNDDDDNGSPRFVLRDRPKNVTLDDAVEAAVRGIKFKR